MKHIRRTRLVSFRLSDEEYEALTNLSISEGARSVSDCARTVINKILFVPTQSNTPVSAVSTFTEAVSALVTSMEELRHVIQKVSGDVAKGSDAGKENHGKNPHFSGQESFPGE